MLQRSPIILLLLSIFILQVKSKLYVRSDTVSSPAPILSSFFGVESPYQDVTIEPFRVEPSDWECDTCPPRYVGIKSLSNMIAVGDTGECYKCGFQSFSSALAESGASGWIRFTTNSLSFDYLEVYKPGYEYRTFWYRDIGKDKEHLKNFFAVIGTSHELLDWFENDVFENTTIRLSFDEDYDANAFLSIWDSPFFYILQVGFCVWSLFNMVLCVWRIRRWHLEIGDTVFKGIPFKVLLTELFQNIIICIITIDPVFSRGVFPYEVNSFFGSLFIPLMLFSTALVDIFFSNLNTKQRNSGRALVNPYAIGSITRPQFVLIGVFMMIEVVTNIGRSFFGLFTTGPFLAMQLALVVIECCVVTTLFVLHGRDLHDQLLKVKFGEIKEKIETQNVSHTKNIFKKVSNRIRAVIQFSMRRKPSRMIPASLSQTARFYTLLVRCLIFNICMLFGMILGGYFISNPILSCVFLFLFAFCILSFSTTKIEIFVPKEKAYPSISSCLPGISNKVVPEEYSKPTKAIELRRERKHDSNKIEMRAVSVDMLNHFLETHVPKDRRDKITTFEVVEEIIKPLTKNCNMSYAKMCCDKGNEDGIPFVGPACAFVSHSWSYKFVTLLSVLEEYESCHLEQGNLYFFLDMFAFNQHSVASDELLTSLKNVVKMTNKVLLVMTPWKNPRPLGRVWCLWEILQAVKLDATIRMVLPGEDQDAFMIALQTKFNQVEKSLASIDVVNANATVESDKWMIFAEIERSLGSRKKIEALCKNMGLDVEVKSPRKSGESESDWINRQSENFFLRRSARGSAEEGGVVQWDHVDRTVSRIDDGTILYNLHDGLNRMNDMLSKQMCKALSDVTLYNAMRGVKPTPQKKIRKTRH